MPPPREWWQKPALQSYNHTVPAPLRILPTSNQGEIFWNPGKWFRSLPRFRNLFIFRDVINLKFCSSPFLEFSVLHPPENYLTDFKASRLCFATFSRCVRLYSSSATRFHLYPHPVSLSRPVHTGASSYPASALLSFSFSLAIRMLASAPASIHIFLHHVDGSIVPISLIAVAE